MNNEEMKKRAMDKNALPMIFSIKIVKAEENHRIAVGLKSAFEKKKIRLLQDDMKGRDYLTDKQAFESKTDYEKSLLLKPYIQTTALVNELVNLEYEVRGGFIKIRETGRNRKDRFSSLGYANHFANILEADLHKEEFDEDDDIIYF
ncbi:MAG: hypothetical protein WD512_05400 [Candidatus Paceibacterota bacterium]